MTEKKNTCPICKNQLNPAKAEIIIDMYKVTIMASEAYMTAFYAACASVENNKFEYRRLADKLDTLVQRIMEIHAKYIH